MTFLRLLLPNDPNLNLLGIREPDVHGERTRTAVEAGGHRERTSLERKATVDPTRSLFLGFPA
jgi:3-dehydroquinate dehydratase